MVPRPATWPATSATCLSPWAAASLHSAKAAGGEQLPGIVEVEMLDGPHLMLAYVGGALPSAHYYRSVQQRHLGHGAPVAEPHLSQALLRDHSGPGPRFCQAGRGLRPEGPLSRGTEGSRRGRMCSFQAGWLYWGRRSLSRERTRLAEPMMWWSVRTFLSISERSMSIWTILA
mgnify:CR=1 FL=1